MDKQEKLQKKMRRKKEKQRRKRWKKINGGLDLCLILSCFLAFLAAAVTRIFRERAPGSSKGLD